MLVDDLQASPLRVGPIHIACFYPTRREKPCPLQLPCPNVPAEVLNPRDMWADKDAYDEQAKKLAAMFIKNFSKYNNMPENIINAGPKQMLD